MQKLLLSALMIAISGTSLADTTPSFFSERKHSAESVAPHLKTLQMCGRAGTRQAYLDATIDWLQLCSASKSQLDEIHQIFAEGAEPIDCQDADRVTPLIKYLTENTYKRMNIDKEIIRIEKERVQKNPESASCVAVAP